MELRLTPARLGAAALAALCIAPALASPLPAEDFAKIPTIQSVTMSADGKQLVAIVAAPGSNNSDTALANWNLDNLGAGPVAITPSGDRMKFIAASALKAGRNLVIGRQEWTGKLGGCGEGNSTGATKTFLTKAYLTDATQTKFDEAFANNTRTLGDCRWMQTGSSSVSSTKPRCRPTTTASTCAPARPNCCSRAARAHHLACSTPGQVKS
jgi:hypothetical protein